MGLAVANGHASGLAPERLRDVPGDDHAAERKVPARHALRERDQVRLYAEALEAEPGADTAEAADHRVAHEQHTGVAADGGDALDVTLRGWKDTAGADHRLHEKGGDSPGPDPLDLVSECVRRVPLDV